ncbi:hypothetical protein RB195_021834 [Necator americanus]|uniref:SCP domain-containing protein n=1 Tax=Necator americanus TaxID=51031 RepID=A0ABR1EDV2_NECAM
MRQRRSSNLGLQCNVNRHQSTDFSSTFIVFHICQENAVPRSNFIMRQKPLQYLRSKHRKIVGVHEQLKCSCRVELYARQYLLLQRRDNLISYNNTILLEKNEYKGELTRGKKLIALFNEAADMWLKELERFYGFAGVFGCGFRFTNPLGFVCLFG